MVRERWPRRAAVLALLLAGSPRAMAYEGPLHHAMVQVAFAISPAARARIPARFLGGVYRGAEEADQPNVTCDLHGGAAGAGAAEAQKLLAYLLRTQAAPWSSNRALVVGRLLHLVSDAVVPEALMRDDPNARATLFSGRELALYREPAEPTAALGELLLSAVSQTRWADDPADDDGSRLRAAVNLCVEVLLRLPVAPGETEGADGGVAVFVVDRIAAGVASQARLEPVRKGLAILEWATRAAGPETVHRLLVFNPTALCGREIVLRSGEFHRSVPVALPPHAFRRVEVRLPSTLSRRLVRTQSLASDLCPPGLDVSGAVPIRAAATVAGTAGAAPDVDASPVVPY